MPAVENFSRLGYMGVVLSTCTTALVSTAPSMAPRPRIAPETPHHRKRPGSLCLGTALQWTIRKFLSPLDCNSPPTGVHGTGSTPEPPLFGSSAPAIFA